MSWSLVIDQSTSATKAIAFDEGFHKLAFATRSHRQISPQPGWFEHDAEEIWENTQLAISELICSNQVTGLPDFLSITNQRETIVVFDRESGKPLYNAIVWQCARGSDICGELSSSLSDLEVASKTGLKIDTYFSASKLTWLVENVHGLKEKLASGEAIVGTIDTYLIYRLTKGSVYATDYTNASRTLLFDIHRLTWDALLCQMFRLPQFTLPEVKESSCHFGETDINKILPRSIPIIGVMGDSQAALFAQHCFEPGSAKATFGTGTSVLLNIGHQFRYSQGATVTALAWVINKQPTYALEGLINYSAATLTWLKDQLHLISTLAETESLATSVEDSGDVFLIPAFAGLGAPYWNSGARAAIVGMTSQTTRAHVVRAALESIAFQLRDILEMLSSASQVKIQRINADGGAITNHFLMQRISDICGVEIQASGVAELSALGAAQMGRLGLGRAWLSDDLIRQACELHPSGQSASYADSLASDLQPLMYRPVVDRAAANRSYEHWQAAVQRVL